MRPDSPAQEAIIIPRTTQEAIDQAEQLAQRFEQYEPDSGEVTDAAALRNLREAILARPASERDVAEAVATHQTGHAWSAIGAMLGTSGEPGRRNAA